MMIQEKVLGFDNKKHKRFHQNTEDNDDDDEEDENNDEIINFLGTNLIDIDGNMEKCFSSDEVQILAMRKEFEKFMPKELSHNFVDNKFIETLMHYFFAVNKIILETYDGDKKAYAQKVFFDTLGGYLNYYVVPVTKLSFYAGFVSLRKTQGMITLLKQCKLFLNTYGNGWRPPLNKFKNFNISNIKPLNISSRRRKTPPCIKLELYDGGNELNDDTYMLIPLPKLLNNEPHQLSNIWLPLKPKRIFDLRSKLSAYILIRYYVAVTECYRYQGVCQKSFNIKFRDWIIENIEQHLNDDALYPGLGAVLRILQTLHGIEGSVRNYDKVRKSDDKVRKSDDNQNFWISKSSIHTNDKSRSSEYLRIKQKANEISKFEKSGNVFDKSSNENDNRNSIFSQIINSDDNNVPNPTVIPKLQSNNDYNDDDDDSSTVSSMRKKYMIFAVILVISLLIFVLIVAVITKYMSDGHDSAKKNDKNTKKNVGRKCRNCCEWFEYCVCCCRKNADNNDDNNVKDEIDPLLSADDKSDERDIKLKSSVELTSSDESTSKYRTVKCVPCISKQSKKIDVQQTPKQSKEQQIQTTGNVTNRDDSKFISPITTTVGKSTQSSKPMPNNDINPKKKLYMPRKTKVLIKETAKEQVKPSEIVSSDEVLRKPPIRKFRSININSKQK